MSSITAIWIVSTMWETLAKIFLYSYSYYGFIRLIFLPTAKCKPSYCSVVILVMYILMQLLRFCSFHEFFALFPSRITWVMLYMLNCHKFLELWLRERILVQLKVWRQPGRSILQFLEKRLRSTLSQMVLLDWWVL